MDEAVKEALEERHQENLAWLENLTDQLQAELAIKRQRLDDLRHEMAQLQCQFRALAYVIAYIKRSERERGNAKV